MTSLKEGFYFNPKKWLSDSKLLLMDWDCKAMHLQLMCISWNNEPKGYILNDESSLLKIIGNPNLDEWNNRIKKQILSSWKEKLLLINNETKSYLYHPGLIKIIEQENSKKNTNPKSRAKKNVSQKMLEENEIINFGFELETLLKEKNTITVLYEKANKEDKDTIWNLGVNILNKQLNNEKVARAFLAKQIKIFGEKPVAECIAKLSIRNTMPADIQSYLIGVLKKQESNEQPIIQKRTGRGSVSL